MGIFSNPWQGIDRFFRHPIDEVTHPFGHHDKWQHFKKDVGEAGKILGAAALAVATDGASLAAESGGIFADAVAGETAKNWGSTLGRSLWGTTKKKTKKLVNNKRPTKENTAFYGKNKHRSQIPEGSTLLRESRYSEVYRDPDGKIHVWGKPTIAPNPKNLLLHPYSTGREWGENARRRFDPKYRKSDPVYRDMAKIRKEYGRADHISGYSRGGAYANMQPYSNKTEYTIHGAYTPWNEPDRRIKIRTSWKDPVHKYARYVSANPYGRMGPKGRRR